MHPVFDELQMQQLRLESFDSSLDAAAETLTCVFFWGHNCPNCEVAKRSLLSHEDLVKPLGLKWFHVNVYEDGDLGTRFGLHGIPAFFFFYKGKKLGKISPFPGIDPFLEAIRNLQEKIRS